MKKFLCLMLTAFLFITSFFVAVSAENYENIVFYDAETGVAYSAHIFTRKTEIYRGSELLIDIELDNILSCSASGGIISLYEADSVNKQLCIYRYNIYENTMESFAVNRDPLCHSLCYTSDSYGKVYFISSYKISCLCVYDILENSIKEYELNSRVRQLISIDGNNVLIITDNAVYVLENELCKKVKDSSLPYPVSFEGNLKISDANGNTYNISDFNFQEETTILFTEPESNEAKCTDTSLFNETEAIDLGIEFDAISKNTYSVPEGITVSKIKGAFASLKVAKVTKADGSVITSGKIGTATKVILDTGEEITLIILGEITGEGNINSRDTKAILEHLCGNENLTEPFYTAADINSDGEITTKDALLISKMY